MVNRGSWRYYMYTRLGYHTFQVDLIINHPPHDDQANATRIPGSVLPLRSPVSPDQLFELVAAHFPGVEVAARVHGGDFARGEVFL